MPGRIKSLNDWQFRQSVYAIQILFECLIQTDRRRQLAEYRGSRIAGGNKHWLKDGLPTLTRYALRQEHGSRNVTRNRNPSREECLGDIPDRAQMALSAIANGFIY